LLQTHTQAIFGSFYIPVAAGGFGKSVGSASIVLPLTDLPSVACVCVSPKWLTSPLERLSMKTRLGMHAIVSHRAAMAQVMETKAAVNVADIIKAVAVADDPNCLLQLVLDAKANWQLQPLQPGLFTNIAHCDAAFLLSYDIQGQCWCWHVNPAQCQSVVVPSGGKDHWQVLSERGRHTRRRRHD
jgi:hypothetical protein